MELRPPRGRLRTGSANVSRIRDFRMFGVFSKLGKLCMSSMRVDFRTAHGIIAVLAGDELD